MSTLKRIARGLKKAKERKKYLKLKFGKPSKSFGGVDYRYDITRPNEPSKVIRGALYYMPDEKKVVIDSMHTVKKTWAPKPTSITRGWPKEDLESAAIRPLRYEEAARKSLSHKDIRFLLKEIAKKFPKAKILEGKRGSGMHSHYGRKQRQVFNLERLRKK